MTTKRNRRITQALTRKSNRGRRSLDPKHILSVTIALILGILYAFSQRILVSLDSDISSSSSSSSALSDLHSEVVQQKVSAAASETGGGASRHQNQQLNNQNRMNFRSDLDPDLPKWIRDYIAWHREIRTKFPGDELFTNPEAPNVLIRTCLGLCGGLHDRLGQLPWDLFLANQTGRVLFLRWYRPKPIEDFLVPNAFNWSMPPNIPGFDRLQSVKHTITELFDGTDDSHPETEFWNPNHLEASIERAKSGKFQKVKILRHRILGHLNEDELEKRLQKLGETDMIHSTKTFGKIFFLFFHPSPAVEMELEDVYESLKISPSHYSAVHCRVRHPKAFSKHIGVVKGKWDKYPADKTGLPWEGQTRDFAVETATDALQCAKTLRDDPKEPIYFFSDSNDLVRYITRELSNQTFVSANLTILKNNPIDWTALQHIQSSNVVARDVDIENAHIDRQKGRAPPAYYGTFVDLFLAINARCITFGIGYYAVFAAKISGTRCKKLYTEEAWGGNERKKLLADVCKQ